MQGFEQRRAARRGRIVFLLLWAGFVLVLVGLGIGYLPRSRAAADLVLPQATSVQLVRLSDGPTERFALDQPTPDFTLTYADGRRLRLSDLRGRPVVLNFWATWCTPCKAEMPELQNHYSAAGDSFELLAINMREAPTVAAAFGAELGLTSPWRGGRSSTVTRWFNIRWS